jgi:hypothetical protein
LLTGLLKGFLLPAVAGVCAFRPEESVTVLEIALPD